MIRSDFHVHSSYCDGKGAISEIAEAAVGRGMNAIGFSSHLPMPSAVYGAYEYCMSLPKEQAYVRDVLSVKESMRGKIDVYLGGEADYYSVYERKNYDYVIGSVHHVEHNGAFMAVDDTAEILIEGINRIYGGDCYACIRDYYENVGSIYQKTDCDIIGHFDVITKFNKNNAIFDATGAKYLDLAYEAALKLIATGVPFEINTGAMSRGYRDEPYPSKEIIAFIARNGGKFVLSSDCHRKENLMYKFSEARSHALSCDEAVEIVDFSGIIGAKNK